MAGKNIVIIGAGPVGCYTAQLLKIYGFNPLLIEEHSEVGRPIHCTGLVGSKVFSQRWPFKLSTLSIINTINGALVHYDSQHFAIQRKNVAYVIEREKFDKELSYGLNIIFQNRFLGIEKTKSGYTVGTDKEEIQADMVIGADGANSAVRKLLNEDIGISYFKGVQFRIRHKLKREDLVEVYLKRPYFSWIVPEGEGIVRAGTISESPYQDLEDFIREAKIKGEILERFGGLVALGICDATVKDRIVLVGDAACQLKPLSCGGVYFGLRAATILANCIRDNCLESYDSLWKKELAAEIRVGLKVRNIYGELNKEELKTVFGLLKKHKGLIEKMGDFENHSRLVLKLIKTPGLYTHAGRFLQIIFKRLF